MHATLWHGMADTSSSFLCPCGRSHEDHEVYFAYMITNKPVASNRTIATTIGKVSNYMDVCSNPEYQLKCHNRVQGYPAVDTTLSYGAPGWRFQIVVGPFLDGKLALKFVNTCQTENRKPIPRLLKLVKLANRHNQQQQDTILTVYLIGDVDERQIRRAT